MKKLIICLTLIGSNSALGVSFSAEKWPDRVKLAQRMINNKKKIAELTQAKKNVEAELGVLNTTRELQRKIESYKNEIDKLAEDNEMIALIKYDEGPQLGDIVASIERGPTQT